ncbi:hypothetical protein QLX67_10760, partial [Balneolaceae bacterium ANBcel3]|nr:hypothetical protein [Balneolaceae bacterium ANBcel3]
MTRKSGLMNATAPLLLVCMLLSSVALQARAEQPMPPVQLASVQQVGATVLSEDGAYVAFTKIIPADPLKENERASQELYLYHVGEDRIVKVETEARISQLAQRPGKGTFSFVMNTEDDDHGTLYELRPDRQRIERVYAHTSGILSYEWHPSGDMLSVISREDLNLPENPLPYEPDVYEEYLPNREGYLVELRRRRSARVQPIAVEGSIYEMSWSPDGNRLAISETPTPHIDDYYMFQKVRIIDRETGRVVADIDNEGKLGQITWSPDGSKIALRAGNSIHDPIDGRIMVVSADGGTPV